ncbi:hypothetical protein LTR56_025360 [Elasticomyces elasticus]|nr:hypothetical protein LTR56_025360 [Elasticomyces elasticus]KAK3655286.1 hypothetical protein LTR22_010316 [Elasticomyces elasticus]KAK4918642.1 hypothetical protein LTR49_013567 [Elasticomyces elasticus]KAK5748826.1 hypothetical protein LTS12_021123 [Elasticomyces elasticus]
MLDSEPLGRYMDQGGLRNLAETLYQHYGNRIFCPNCPQPEELVRAYCKDEGRNGSEGGQKRRQFRCRNSVKRRRGSGISYSICLCVNYVKRAIDIIGEERVDRHRRELLAKLSEQGKDTSRIDKRILKPTNLHIEQPKDEDQKPVKLEYPTAPLKLELGRPKRAATSLPLATLAKPNSNADVKPTYKRPRLASPLPVERQLTGLSRQVEILRTELRKVKTLLVEQATSSLAYGEADDLVLDYEPTNSP